MNKSKTFLLLLLIVPSLLSAADNPVKDAVAKGIRYDFTEDGKNFAKFSVSSQLWLRYSELNPGVTDAAGKEISGDFDILLRRNFFNAFAVIDKFTFFAMYCMSSEPANTSINPGAAKQEYLYMYDAFGSYEFIPQHLTMGFGLNMYAGASRFHSASSGQTLGVDVPLITAPNLLSTGQSARRLNVFATGMAGNLAYSAAIYKPFIPKEFNPLSAPAENKAGDYRNYNLGVNARLEWQLFDKEPPNRLPFKSATELSGKKIFNLGVGTDYLPEGSMSYAEEDGAIELHDKLHIAADAYFDVPLKNKAAISLYAGYFYTDFGPNYLISFGNSDTWGNGITEPQHGTGQAVYCHAAYAFPEMENGSRVQPFATGTYKQFEALEDNITTYSLGVNYFYIGHKIKFTLEYLTRPYVIDQQVDSYKYQVVGKMQLTI